MVLPFLRGYRAGDRSVTPKSLTYFQLIERAPGNRHKAPNTAGRNEHAIDPGGPDETGKAPFKSSRDIAKIDGGIQGWGAILSLKRKKPPVNF